MPEGHAEAIESLLAHAGLDLVSQSHSLRMGDMSDLFAQGNMTPQRCEFLCCHGYASIVTCYPRDLTRSCGRNRLKA